MDYAAHLSHCSNCGGEITAAQIALALDDASIGTDAEAQDTLTLCCATYTDARGCQGNDPTAVPYWYTR